MSGSNTLRRYSIAALSAISLIILKNIRLQKTDRWAQDAHNPSLVTVIFLISLIREYQELIFFFLTDSRVTPTLSYWHRVSPAAPQHKESV